MLFHERDEGLSNRHAQTQSEAAISVIAINQGSVAVRTPSAMAFQM